MVSGWTIPSLCILALKVLGCRPGIAAAQPLSAGPHIYYYDSKVPPSDNGFMWPRYTPRLAQGDSNRVTEGKKPQIRRLRYAHLSAFFNFIRNNIDPDFRNPCDTPAMKRLLRNKAPVCWNTMDKDTVDEVIFRTSKTRNRLMLELMARGGMRVGEVLKLTPNDISDRKLTLREPESGWIHKTVFIPQKDEGLSKRKDFQPGREELSICNEAVRAMVKKAGDVVG